MARRTLTDCTISGNSADDAGGGLYNDGTATLTDCTISGNSAVLRRRPVYDVSGSATLTDTIVAGNTATGIASDIDVQLRAPTSPARTT